jgi:uncharacterized membrane protein YhhN
LEFTILSIAIFISALAAIAFRQRHNIKPYGVFKALTTILIIVLAVCIFRTNSGSYQLFILIALCFALVGDIFLINKRFFLHGIIAFSLAHLFFMFGFASLHGFSPAVLPGIFLLITASIIYEFLRKDLNKYALPVGIYIVIILVMVWQAVGLLYHSTAPLFWSVAAAAVLFAVSDFVIAYNKFKQAFKAAEPIILGTYWIAVYSFTFAGNYIH